MKNHKNKTIHLRDVGERGVIKHVVPALSKLHKNFFLVPPGDDAAVLKKSPRAVLSIDGLTESTHFKFSWFRQWNSAFGFSFGEGLGWKLLGRSLSDLAAMGDVDSRWAMVYLGAPGNLPFSLIKDIFKGVREAAQRFKCVLVGGDTSKSTQLTLVSAVGGNLVGKRPLTRDGASAGDLIAISGTVGDASVGLKILERKLTLPSKADSHYFVEKFFKHEPLFNQGKILARENGVSSLIDLSDSLAESINIILGKKNLGANIYIDQIPVSKVFESHFSTDPSILSGGEDYSLLFTVKKSALSRLRKKLKFQIIGEVKPGQSGVQYFRRAKKIKTGSYFEHFKS